MKKSIRLEGISKSKQGHLILDNISLEVPLGEFFALLGPSGCGKTTLLRLIAGLEHVDRGKIFLGDQEITHQPIHKRKINVVFQNYALFPHLSVFNNIAYPLAIAGCPKEEIESKVHKLLKVFHLDAQTTKHPSELSGGQQQRVAIARAIIGEPEVLLLDEPLAALDFKLREKLLIELIDLQDKLHTTFVYVTHDQTEALTVADHMAIMNHQGDIAQFGTPKEIYEFPDSTFVAEFVGSTNIFEGVLVSDGQEAKFTVGELGTFSVLPFSSKKPIVCGAKKAILSVRPEKIYISKRPEENFSNSLKGVVHSIVYNGRSTLYEVFLPNRKKIQVFEQNEEHFPKENIDYDDQVFLSWQKENGQLLEV